MHAIHTLLLLVVAAVVALLSGSAQAHMIELGPSKSECFFEDLNPGDQVSSASMEQHCTRAGSGWQRMYAV